MSSGDFTNKYKHIIPFMDGSSSLLVHDARSSEGPSGSSPDPSCCSCSMAAGCQARADCLPKTVPFWHMFWQHISGEGSTSHVANYTPRPWNRLMSLAERGCGAVSVTAKILQYRLRLTDCVTDLLTRETGQARAICVGTRGFPGDSYLCSTAAASTCRAYFSQGPSTHTCRAVPAHAREAAQSWHAEPWWAGITASSLAGITAIDAELLFPASQPVL